MNYINSSIIFEEISQFKILGGYWNPEEVYGWIYKALSIIDNNTNVVIVDLELFLEDGKVKLPANIQHIKKIVSNYNGKELIESRDKVTLRESMDYVLNNGYLYTEMGESILITYTTIPLDEDDLPMIPDSPYFINALTDYVKFKIGERSFFEGNLLQGQYSILQQNWLYSVGGATTDGKMGVMDNRRRFKKLHNVHRV